jgi:hypothetical protein
VLNNRLRPLMAVVLTLGALCALGALGTACAASKPEEKVAAKVGMKSLARPSAKNAEKRIDKPLDKVADQAEALSDEQLALVPRVNTGVLPCELSHSVSVQAHPQHAGHFVVASGKQRFAMVPVATNSGAIRLEDAARGAVWLQLANKSMLMDEKRGRRLADACMSPEQHAVALAMEKDPASHLLAPAPANAPQTGIATK